MFIRQESPSSQQLLSNQMKPDNGQVTRKKKYKKRRNTGTRTFKVAATTSQGSSGGQEGMLHHVDQPWVQLPLEFDLHQKRQRHTQRKQRSERHRSETEIDGLPTRTSSLDLPDSSDLPLSESSNSTLPTVYAYNMPSSNAGISHAASTHSYELSESTGNIFVPFVSPISTFPDNVANFEHKQVRVATAASSSESLSNSTYSPPTSVYQEHGSLYQQIPGDITSTPDFNTLGYHPLSDNIQMLMNHSSEAVDTLGWDTHSPITNIPHHLTASNSTSTPSTTATIFDPLNTYSSSYLMPENNPYPSLSMNYGYTYHRKPDSTTSFCDGSLGSGFPSLERVHTQPAIPPAHQATSTHWASTSSRQIFIPDSQYHGLVGDMTMSGLYTHIY